MIDYPKPLFPLGQIFMTPAASRAIDEAHETANAFVERHARGDWGDVADEDAEANEAAILDGGRILSAYTLKDGVRVWVLTEVASSSGERKTTTILLPSDY